MVTDKIETEYYDLTILDWYLNIEFKDNAVLDLKHSQQLFYHRTTLCNGVAYPDVWDASGLLYVTKEAMTFAAKPENTLLVKAGGLFIDSSVKAILANYYLMFKKPPVPTKFFHSKEKVLTWLQQFR